MVSKEVKIKNFLAGTLVILLLIVGMFFIKGFFEGRFRSIETLRIYVQTLGILAPVILTLIQMLQVIFPVLPGFIGCAAAVGMFGAFGGFWCNYIGICTGSIAAFLMAKWLGNNLVRLMISEEKYASYVAWISKKKSYTVLLLLSILLPLAPDDFLCYFSGLIGMETKKFVWIILLCKPWVIFFTVYCSGIFYSKYFRKCGLPVIRMHRRRADGSMRLFMYHRLCVFI